MNTMKLEQPSWKTLLKTCGTIVLIGCGFTMVVCGVNAVFKFLVEWIIGVI